MKVLAILYAAATVATGALAATAKCSEPQIVDNYQNFGSSSMNYIGGISGGEWCPILPSDQLEKCSG